MRSQAQIDASRANGAKSRGPVTPEGRRISAANSRFSTGPRSPESEARRAEKARLQELLANSVLYDAESRPWFLERLRKFEEAHQPVGFLEENAVERIAIADWRRRRSWDVESASVEYKTKLNMETSDEFTQRQNNELASTNTAIAMSDLANTGRSLEFFRRYEAQASREYRYALAELEKLQAKRFAQEAIDRQENFLNKIEEDMECEEFLSVKDFAAQPENSSPSRNCEEANCSGDEPEPEVTPESPQKKLKTEPNTSSPRPYPWAKNSASTPEPNEKIDLDIEPDDLAA